MPHYRNRLILSKILEDIKFWPIISLVGARQTGKTTLLKSLEKWKYITLDQSSIFQSALADPSSIIQNKSIIDEVQKVPAIFDEVKNYVDTNKRPGSFILSGSIRFSKRTHIRESLTGRSITLEMHPMSVIESLGLNIHEPKKSQVTRAEFLRHLSRGGMPGIFSLRDNSKIRSYWNALIDSYLYRDLLMILEKNPKPKLAESILKAICNTLILGELPTFSRIFKKVGGTRSVVQKHLQALEDMMILYALPRCDGASTSTIYLPFDNGLFLAVGNIENIQEDQAILKSCIWINAINELRVFQNTIHGYAESKTGEIIHAVFNHSNQKNIKSLQISGDVIPHAYSTRFLKAFAESKKAFPFVLSPIKQEQTIHDLNIIPWENIIKII